MIYELLLLLSVIKKKMTNQEPDVLLFFKVGKKDPLEVLKILRKTLPGYRWVDLPLSKTMLGDIIAKGNWNDKQLIKIQEIAASLEIELDIGKLYGY